MQLRSTLITWQSADGEELANNAEAELDDDASEGEEEGHKGNEQAVNNREDGADETAKAVTKSDLHNDIKENLNICDNRKDEAESTEQSLWKLDQ